MTERIVVGMTGATGQIYGIKALELIQDTEYSSHLILSEASKINLEQETSFVPSEVVALASESYDVRNIGAPTASGSFEAAGMLVAPCSMKTLSNIAHANSGNLITRSADVTLKERRPLVVMPREKPFNRIHLKNMLELTDAGGIVMPPFPSFYHDSENIEAMVSRTVARTLNLIGIDIDYDEWVGIGRQSG